MRTRSIAILALASTLLTGGADAWSGAGGQAAVSSEGVQEVPERDIREAVAAFIRDNAPWPSEQVEVEDIYVPGPAYVPRGRVTLHVSAPKGGRFVGRSNFAVGVSVDRRPVRTVWVAAEITVWSEVIVALRTLYKGEILDAAGVAVDRRRMKDVPRGAVLRVDDVVGKRVSRLVPAGSAVTSTAVEVPPVIRKGDWVTILAEGGSVRVSAPGEAREEGAPGETIRVANRASKRTVQAKVVDSKTVRVEW
ncbi:MAG: flagellar basal body P-ring formation protein FlgA [Nitrospirae bacterium]|nr:flagellar basal body P-ring formation protein FlgA [Nitrospirota bacterium]